MLLQPHHLFGSLSLLCPIDCWDTAKMRSLVSFLLLVLAAAVQAISSNGGNRLLVILEDVAEKDGYSKFIGDLEGMYARAGPCGRNPHHQPHLHLANCRRGYRTRL